MIEREWGVWYDPDTEQGIQRYLDEGLRLDTPHDIQAMDSSDRYAVATQCNSLLDAVYRGNYPSSAKDIATLAVSVETQGTNLFTLSDEASRILAMASLVKRGNSMGGSIGFLELSKAAKLQDTEHASGISARHLSKFRLPWAFQNLLDTDFIYGSPRVAANGTNGTPGGQQAQSVWWGGRRHGIDLPLIATNVGWNFKVGGIEPLSGFVAPVQPNEWSEAVREQPVYLPDAETKRAIDTLFDEATHGKVQPRTKVVSTHEDSQFAAFMEARPPSADIVTKYYMTQAAPHLTERSASEVDEQLQDAISQKVIIESDLAAKPAGGLLMRQLLDAGWALAGWQPSEVTYGGICPMLARVNPAQVEHLIQPVHYEQYFNDGGLGGTKRILDGMYHQMYQNAVTQVSGLNPRRQA